MYFLICILKLIHLRFKITSFDTHMKDEEINSLMLSPSFLFVFSLLLYLLEFFGSGYFLQFISFFTLSCLKAVILV